jgi:hypothetical protein
MSPLRAYAMQVAWEHVYHWQTFLTAREAAEAVGIKARDWRTVAARVADLWIEMQEQKFVEFARAA